MITRNLSIVAACLALAMAGFSNASDAKGRNKSKHKKDKEYSTQLPSDSKKYHDDDDYKEHRKGKYPNGRPWQALEKDMYILKARTKRILYKINGMETDIDDLQDDVRDIAGDVSDLKNTLQVQVSVVPATPDEHRANNTVARVFVQVNQNGMAVVGLDSDAFSFTNSFFPKGNKTDYCGLRCFTKAADGLYALDLKGDDFTTGDYAGTLVVEDDASRALPTGTSLVTFEVPESDLAVTPR